MGLVLTVVQSTSVVVEVAGDERRLAHHELLAPLRDKKMNQNITNNS